MDDKKTLKSDKQYILPIIYVISIYLFSILSIVRLVVYGEGYLSKGINFLLIFGLILILILLILNILNGISFFKSNKTSKELLFLSMIMKISFILLYVVYFVIEFAMFCTAIGMVVAIILFMFGYVILMPSSFYALFGNIRAMEKGEISNLYGIIASVSSFLLFFDVFFTIVSYIKVKRASLRESNVGYRMDVKER